MRPPSTRYDMSDERFAASHFIANSTVRHTAALERSNAPDAIIIYDTFWIFLAGIEICAATLLVPAIGDILQLSAEGKVRWIDALRVVARMHDNQPHRYAALECDVRHAMCSILALAAHYVGSTISILVETKLPFPAACFSNLGAL